MSSAQSLAIDKYGGKVAMLHGSEGNGLTEWFHELAMQSPQDLALQATAANLDKLRVHIAVSLPNYSLPLDVDTDRFADVVLELRKNEKSWNQATMAALIRADDLYKQGQVEDARTELHRFAATCPWSVFKEVALNQATNYR